MLCINAYFAVKINDMAGIIDAIPFVGTGLSVAGSIFGQIQANKAQKQYDGFLSNRRKELTSKLNASQYGDYLSSDTAKSALEQIRKNMKATREATTNSAIQGGATPEAVIATEGKMQDKYQDAIGSLVAQGDQIKQRDRYMYEGLGQSLDNQQAMSNAQKIMQWGQFGQNVAGATSGIMNAWANGGFDGKVSRAKLLKKYKFRPGSYVPAGEPQ